MKRTCPHCHKKSVPVSIIIPNIGGIRCKNCDSKLVKSELIGYVSFFVVALVMFFLLLILLKLYGFTGIIISMFAWLVAEIIREIYIPLRVKTEGMTPKLDQEEIK